VGQKSIINALLKPVIFGILVNRFLLFKVIYRQHHLLLSFYIPCIFGHECSEVGLPGIQAFLSLSLFFLFFFLLISHPIYQLGHRVDVILNSHFK
jgi:hypothetical protein